jgi:hypothetical protein
VNTTVLPALAGSSNQKHQPVKTSLQKRSLRAAGLAIAIGLAVGNANAAISVIATPTSTNGGRIYLKFNGTDLTIGDNSGYTLRIDYQSTNVINLGDRNSIYTGDGFTSTGPVVQGTAISSDLTYNGNGSSALPTSAYYGFKYGTGLATSPLFHYGWVNLTASGSSPNKILTLNSAAINTTAGESILAGQTTATAVPEPGTFFPSALLVMGALLRRRRGRAHRSGRAAA